jgi:hypothetical protein
MVQSSTWKYKRGTKSMQQFTKWVHACIESKQINGHQTEITANDD